MASLRTPAAALDPVAAALNPLAAALNTELEAAAAVYGARGVLDGLR